MFDGPKVEVHITNIHKREPMYQKSLMSHGVTGVIAGLGGTGYALAIDALAALAKAGTRTARSNKPGPAQYFNDMQNHFGRRRC